MNIMKLKPFVYCLLAATLLFFSCKDSDKKSDKDEDSVEKSDKKSDKSNDPIDIIETLSNDISKQSLADLWEELSTWRIVESLYDNNDHDKNVVG